jgi:hypothetical protein
VTADERAIAGHVAEAAVGHRQIGFGQPLSNVEAGLITFRRLGQIALCLEDVADRS